MESSDWAEMIELRIGTPVYTPSNQKLYPIYLHRENHPTETKYYEPQRASDLGDILCNLFEMIETWRPA